MADTLADPNGIAIGIAIAIAIERPTTASHRDNGYSGSTAHPPDGYTALTLDNVDARRNGLAAKPQSRKAAKPQSRKAVKP